MTRELAIDIIVKYMEEGSYVNIVLHHTLEEHDLSRKDKDLITRLVYGTIQNKLYLEYQLQPFIEGKKVKPRIKAILLVSFYQLLFLDKVPTYAVIHEAVELANQKDRYAGKFVNAILRNFLREGQKDIDVKTKEEELSIRTSHPLWMVKMLSKQYGFEQTCNICCSNNEPPTKAARVNTLKASVHELLTIDGVSKGTLSEDAVLFSVGNIASTEAYKKGLVTIQDESSQLVGRFLNPEKDDYILDMCCAPGSKTTHLSAIMENTGRIDAYDIHAHKIELVKQNANRLGATNIQFCVGDSTLLKEQYPAETFDKILLDAPCSGFGVVRRKPEIKYHDSSLMDTIIPLQINLLENAYYLLKNNGKMVYSTCTLNKKENTQVIQQFIEKHPDMKVVVEKTIFPHQYHTDGFYMCKLEKEK